MSRKLLYFNLAVDETDTSLGFAVKWIETIAKKYDHVDVVSLKKVSNPVFSQSIKIYGPEPSKRKLRKYIYLFKKVKELCKENDYERCFSHMSPISVVVSSILLQKNNIKTTLWFTHPGPNFGIKKLILFLSFLFAEHIVTASTSSFPIKSKKVHVIGHAIDLVKFENNKKSYNLNNFLILSRISSSKKLEIAIDGFLNSNFKNHSLDIIGGTLNSNDREYFEKLKKKYSQPNINFLGKVDHKKLPEVLKKYDVHFNSARNGFYDKSVLETLSSEIINFYVNDDFDLLFGNDYYKFANSSDLSEKLNKLEDLKNYQIKNLFSNTKLSLNANSLNSLLYRLEPYL
tara:strand:+ start:1468 stop:2499 length:1032 start_codon:yes stop_codon:yes gene_type:complete